MWFLRENITISGVILLLIGVLFHLFRHGYVLRHIIFVCFRNILFIMGIWTIKEDIFLLGMSDEIWISVSILAGIVEAIVEYKTIPYKLPVQVNIIELQSWINNLSKETKRKLRSTIYNALYGSYIHIIWHAPFILFVTIMLNFLIQKFGIVPYKHAISLFTVFLASYIVGKHYWSRWAWADHYIRLHSAFSGLHLPPVTEKAKKRKRKVDYFLWTTIFSFLIFLIYIPKLLADENFLNFLAQYFGFTGLILFLTMFIFLLLRFLGFLGYSQKIELTWIIIYRTSIFVFISGIGAIVLNLFIGGLSVSISAITISLILVLSMSYMSSKKISFNKFFFVVPLVFVVLFSIENYQKYDVFYIMRSIQKDVEMGLIEKVKRKIEKISESFVFKNPLLNSSIIFNLYLTKANIALKLNNFAIAEENLKYLLSQEWPFLSSKEKFLFNIKLGEFYKLIKNQYFAQQAFSKAEKMVSRQAPYTETSNLLNSVKKLLLNLNLLNPPLLNQIYWKAYFDIQRANNLSVTERVKIFKIVEETGKKVGSYNLIVRAISGLGGAYYELGEYKKAKEYYKKALNIARDFNAKGDEGFYIFKLALVEEKMGKAALALKNFSQTLRLAQEASSYELIWQTEYQMGRILEGQCRKEEAFERYVNAIDVIERIRGRLSRGEYRLRYMAGKLQVYEKAVLLAYRMGKKKEAFAIVQKAKSRVLLDLLGTRMVALTDKDRELAERERLLQIKINALTEIISSEEAKPEKLQSRKLKRWKEELQKALREHEKVLAKIKRTNPHLASLTTASTVSISDVQRLLRPDEAFVEYFVTDKKTLFWAITNSTVRTFEIPYGRKNLNKLVSRIYQNISSSFVPSVSELNRAYTILLRPVIRYFGNRKYLIIAPHDKLYLLPFEVFVVDKGKPIYVVDRWFVSYYPSGSILVLNRKYQEKKPQPRKPLFAIGDPVFSPDDERYVEKKKEYKLAMVTKKRNALSRRIWGGKMIEFKRIPNTGKEVKAIGRLLGVSEKSGDIKTGVKATEREVKKIDHTKYKYEHYATHGVLKGDIPGLREPALVLSLPNLNDPVLDEGFLTMSEIFGLKTNAEMVVLSACTTALGEEVPGEGLVGLTRAFMYAGTPSVVASLWSVDDPATAKLMTSYYRYLKQGRDKAQALSLAKRELRRKGYYNPFYWAPFILHGER